MLCFCSAPVDYWPNTKVFVFCTWHGRVISVCFLIHVNMMFTLVSLLPTYKTRNCIYMSASLGDVICLTTLVTLACNTHVSSGGTVTSTSWVSIRVPFVFRWSLPSCIRRIAAELSQDPSRNKKFESLSTIIIINNILIWYSATSIIVRGASQHITI